MIVFYFIKIFMTSKIFKNIKSWMDYPNKKCKKYGSEEGNILLTKLAKFFIHVLRSGLYITFILHSHLLRLVVCYCR